MPEVKFSQTNLKNSSEAEYQKFSDLKRIPAIALKNCAPEHDPILTRAYQMSYHNGVFPSG